MPELPYELERAIFELALRSNRKDAAFRLTLSLVARRVQFWVDLIFYELVSISNEERADKFVDFIASNLKPPGFFTAVKTLCIVNSVTGAQACAILSACTEVQLLACWVDCTDYPELPILIGRLSLRRLSIELTHFSKIPLVPSTWLLSLTHLDLVVWEPSLRASELSNVSRLPAVTHVSVTSSKVGPEHATIVCSLCPELQLLVVMDDSNGTDDEDNDFLFDSRIVVEDEPQNIIEDWEAPYFGLPDIWSRAEAVLEQRKALAVSVGSPAISDWFL
ncbi:hypothetical protein DFH09DRAFT_1070855 [Mycena vulgaris]|nr:hypothetical protein DFH09DRAFT_1070855 [Mycena vulgaris]